MYTPVQLTPIEGGFLPFLDLVTKKPRVLVFGSRDWPADNMIGKDMVALKGVIGDYVLVHGAARGADTFADDYAVYMNLEVDRYPAAWGTHGKAAGPIRNNDMIASGIDFAMGYILNGSRGSVDMWGRLKGAGIPLRRTNLYIEKSEGFPTFR